MIIAYHGIQLTQTLKTVKLFHSSNTNIKTVCFYVDYNRMLVYSVGST